MSRTGRLIQSESRLVFARHWGREVSANGYRVLHGLRTRFWNKIVEMVGGEFQAM